MTEEQKAREVWLRKAVILLNDQLFKGELDLETHHDYQISVGWTKYRYALGETIFPYEGEDVKLEDFFPVTIHIDCTNKIKDPVMMLEVLAHECIHAFYGIKNHGKAFKMKAKEIGLEAPYTEFHPSQYLIDTCTSIYEQLKKEWGDWPGKPIVPVKKEKKNKKKNTLTIVCPSCDYTIKVSRKMLEMHGGKLPTCSCGKKMELEDDDDESEGTED